MILASQCRPPTVVVALALTRASAFCLGSRSFATIVHAWVPDSTGLLEELQEFNSSPRLRQPNMVSMRIGRKLDRCMDSDMRVQSYCPHNSDASQLGFQTAPVRPLEESQGSISSPTVRQPNMVCVQCGCFHMRADLSHTRTD